MQVAFGECGEVDNEYDVIIVGASLAGASAAIESGKRRLKVAQHFGFVGMQSDSILGRTNIGNVKRECRVADLFLAADAKEEFDPVGEWECLMLSARVFKLRIKSSNSFLGILGTRAHTRNRRKLPLLCGGLHS